MLINNYKNFFIKEKVKIKNDVINSFLLTSFAMGMASEQFVVIDYVMRNKNLITINKIDYDARAILPAQFHFVECEGHLYYGQFEKSFPLFYIFHASTS